MHRILIVIMLCSLAAHARPIEVPSYKDLQTNADLVVILKVQDITETDAKTGHYGDPTFYQGYKAKCQVLSVLKGPQRLETVSVPFFQYPMKLPGFNGAIPAPFSLEHNLVFLAYLKRTEKDQWTPVTGEYDAGLSVKMMFDFPDSRHIKLPPHLAPDSTSPHR